MTISYQNRSTAFLTAGTRWLISAVTVGLLAMATSSVNAASGNRYADPAYHPDTTRKIMQVTGEDDYPLRRPTLSRTLSRAGLLGTDLGSTFEYKGRLYFLFGDSFGRPGGAEDTIAYTTATTAGNLTLEFLRGPDNKFLELKVPGISQGCMEVPSGGIAVNGRIYVVQTTDWHAPTGNMERSVLASSSDEGYTWKVVYDLSADTNHDMTNARFINVSMAEINVADYPGQLPWPDGKVTLIWGSGPYRRSNVCLAAIPSAQIENRQALRYFAGLDTGGKPRWSALESEAAYHFDQPQVGEFSVGWIAQVQRWVMLYNAGHPRGITMRTAEVPWGPWSKGTVIMEPSDIAYGVFQHIPFDVHRADGFLDPGKHEWGGEYGPYLIPRYTTGNADACQIYYMMSTWNPYQAVLMRSEIGKPLPPSAAETTTTMQFVPGDDSWRRSSSGFYREEIRSGAKTICTYAGKQDADTGWMWRWLPRDTLNRRLKFTVCGGAGEVFVLAGGGDIPVSGVSAQELYPRLKQGEFGEVVLCTWGHNSNDNLVHLDWNLMPFDRANLKVVVIDHLTAPWGFVSVSPMALTRAAAGSGRK